MPPSPPRPWSEPQKAFDYGPIAPQRKPGGSEGLAATPEPESEDCLKLNVWTPVLRDGAKRPVMVWLHGGGLWRLSAAGADQEGTRLASLHDVVMVSPNHRLNVLGYAYLDEFDPAFAGSSCAGMLDLVLALKWMRDNIEEFGGDPDNVTIFGQSGGGQKVSFLMAMPAAQGLFHKAIIQSGPAPLTLEKPYARELADRLLGHLEIPAARAMDIQSVPLRNLRQRTEAKRPTLRPGTVGAEQGRELHRLFRRAAMLYLGNDGKVPAPRRPVHCPVAVS